ncbi:hypothetical protein, partial [Frankia sp. CiP3]|uniref:hypothetical protein n=1 Tax=Frankia sp. CiP3 TaxID=2880971 RepID=UPI001EF543A5
TRTCETCGQSFPPGVSHGHGSGHHPDFARDYAREWEAHPATGRRGRRVADLLPASRRRDAHRREPRGAA